MGGVVSQLIKTCELPGMSTPAEYTHEYLEHDLRERTLKVARRRLMWSGAWALCVHYTIALQKKKATCCPITAEMSIFVFVILKYFMRRQVKQSV